ncbi:solute carrier family 40 member 1-like isoform X3 [Ostrea edulis]|uniref:solute carrier family 40 member 1-like isoform X3 n=1 Tax=Ostrea edulis TaxID=37623 RepID=UPI0024AF1E81|nr:solute carrier family 40 member 1-like isoform X3 [Ostrea edulis]
MSTQKYHIERKTKFYVFISHFMSAWGDRMWSFGVGLFLISLSPDSLQLPAVHGFSSGGATLLFAGLVGYWVDNTARLTAARVSLVVQNLLVVLCAAVVFCVFYFGLDKENAAVSDFLIQGSRVLIIMVSILADLASIARKIAIEKDWVVEICGRDKDMLASMTSKLRVIDLCTQILAPILTGQVMTWLGIQYGAVLIGVWNLLSVFVEYYLILKVYQEVPALKSKMYKKKTDKDVANITPPPQEEEERDITEPEDENIITEKGAENLKAPQATSVESQKEVSSSPEKVEEELTGCVWVLSKVFYSFIALYTGYRTYFKYEVALAGLGLSFLYMTVLGFDKITIGYAYSQGLSEAVLGGLQAAGALLGIMGAVVYPRIRMSVGLERTGLFGLGAEILCLCMCVASVWTPGSPFDLLGSPNTEAPNVPNVICNNGSMAYSTNATSQTASIYNTSEHSSVVTLSTILEVSSGISCNETISSPPEVTPDISVWLLMAGIITARFGLWVSDLTITQLFLQSVEETERGIVNSMQNSMNKLMDMLKFAMVIVAPYPHQFGLLVLISFSFICMAWVLYAVYCRRVRGHFFHFEKVTNCVDHQNNNQETLASPDTGAGQAV